MKLYELAVIIFTQMMNSDQTGTQHKNIYRGCKGPMQTSSYHFRLTLAFLSTIPNRVNFNQSSTEQALSSDFVINPDLIDLDFPASQVVTLMGDMNTGEKNRQLLWWEDWKKIIEKTNV